MYKAEKHNIRPDRWIRPDKLVYAACGVAIRAKDVETYCDETFFSALEKWFLTKLWGLARAGGWADQPIDYIEAITAIESENNRIENEEMAAKTSKNVSVNDTTGMKKAPGL